MTEEKIKESPNSDKTLELTDDKPPGMGQGEELVESKEGDETPPPDTGLGEEEKLTPELQALMKKKGIKDVSELAEIVDASDRKITELESERRIQSLIPSEIPERPKIERQFTPFPKLEKEPFDMSREEFEAYQTQREKATEERLTAKYEDAEADKKWKRDQADVRKVLREHGDRFMQIKPQLRELHEKYPDAQLSEIFPLADNMEKTESKERIDKLRKEILGGDIDPDKLKVLAANARPAHISDAGGAGADKTEKKKAEDVIWDAIKDSNMRRDS